MPFTSAPPVSHRPRRVGAACRLRRSTAAATLLVCAAAAAVPRRLDAQVADSASRRDAPLLGRTAVGAAAALAATTILLVPLDRAITHQLRSPGLERNTLWRNAAVVADLYGAGVAYSAGPVLLAVGRLNGEASLADAGLHITESYAAATAAVFLVKSIAGRARPIQVSEHEARSFRLGRGFRSRPRTGCC